MTRLGSWLDCAWLYFSTGNDSFGVLAGLCLVVVQLMLRSGGTGRYGAVRSGTERYGAVRSGTERYEAVRGGAGPYTRGSTVVVRAVCAVGTGSNLAPGQKRQIWF